jgi:isoleucyl-tRNA synthetase
VEELSNWYIRRNRRRFWKPESDADKMAAYETLYDALVIVSKLAAPAIPFLCDVMYRNLVGSIDRDAPTSVHLTDFPVADESLIDSQLSREMSAVLAVVKLGRAARSEANIKVRQPLPAIMVHTPDPADADAVVRLKDQILDELNVKDVLALTELGEVLTYDVKPNLPVLGPKYGKQLGAIRGALAQVDPAVVAMQVTAGETIPLTLPDGSMMELLPNEVLVGMQKREGFAAAQSEEATVVLDTELTPTLISEGLARDFIRGVQDARKQMELNIDDRIDLWFSAYDETAHAITENASEIKREVLAASMTRAEDFSGETSFSEIKVGGDFVTIAMNVVQP